MKTPSPRVWVVPPMAMAFLFLVHAGLAFTVPGHYALDPILKTMTVHLDAASAARSAYLLSGRGEDLASYEKASGELRADADALDAPWLHHRELMEFRRAESAARRLLARMDVQVQRRRMVITQA